MYTSGARNWRFDKMTSKADICHRRAHDGRHSVVSIGRISVYQRV
jgi:hypothetical protein